MQLHIRLVSFLRGPLVGGTCGRLRSPRPHLAHSSFGSPLHWPCGQLSQDETEEKRQRSPLTRPRYNQLSQPFIDSLETSHRLSLELSHHRLLLLCPSGDPSHATLLDQVPGLDPGLLEACSHSLPSQILRVQIISNAITSPHLLSASPAGHCLNLRISSEPSFTEHHTGDSRSLWSAPSFLPLSRQVVVKGHAQHTKAFSEETVSFSVFLALQLC